ncbi:MAG: undecaprenyl-phosphate glucose phosphotransferase [Pirellulaceae bacterium]
MNNTKSITHSSWSLRTIVYRLLDTSCILVGLVIAMWVESKTFDDFTLTVALAAIVAFYLSSEVSGLYRSWRGISLEREILCSVVTWSLACLLLLASSVMMRYAQWVDRSFAITWIVLTASCLGSSRIFMRLVQCYLRSKGFNSRRFAVVGVTELGISLSHKIDHSPEMGLRMVGFYDDRVDERLPEIPAGMEQRIGSIDQLVEDARRGHVNLIYITFPMRAEERIRKVLNKLGDTTASVYIVPDFFVFELLHSRWTHIGGIPAVSVFETPFHGVGGYTKRLLDIALATVLLSVLAIPMSVIAALVKWSSPGPIFFRQKRYGLDGKEILVWKFRSMRVMENGGKVTQATKDDPRTTRIGSILRKTSLDELPQLFNVIQGNMSLVGPRPHASVHNEEYRSLIQGYMLRHKVKPGITGLAQVNGWRGETDTLEKMVGRIECDHRYIREWSLFMDLKILFQTIWVVFNRQNAY